jgi:osmoprotectant transport system substrate-binding protein
MRRRGAALLVVLAAASAGCSGGGTATVSTTPASHGPGVGRPPVVIGNEDFTEQRILGQVYAQALRAKGYRVRLRPDLSDQRAADRALADGQIDAYPEYIGTILRSVAGRTQPPPSEPVAYAATRAFEAPRGLRPLTPTPYARADGLLTTAAFARAHGLTSISDLARLGHVGLGADPDFDRRPSGLPALRRAYGLARARFAPLSQGTQYAALNAGRVQAAVVSATDPRLRSRRYVLLADPRGAFGVQNVVPIVSRTVLAAEGPAFRRTVDAVSAKLTLPAIRRLNAAVEVDKETPAAAAHGFLVSAGFA